MTSRGTRQRWEVVDPSSLLMIDIAAGKDVALQRPMSEEELELATHHGLAGLLVRSADEVTRASVHPSFVRLAARQVIMRRHLHRVLTSLDQAGVRATVLKGPNLGLDVYEDSSLRTYTDIDLLVPAADLEHVLGLLEADPAVPSIPPKGPKADKRDVRFHDDSGIIFSLDLHWDLFSYSQLRGCARGATDWAWSQSSGPIDIGLGPAWRLPDEARLAFLCCHAVLDHRFRLILFRDLFEVCRREPDWDRLFDFTERWRLRSTTYVALLMAHRLLGASVPDFVLKELKPRSVPVRLAERWLARTDIVRFDGHRPHPLNLAMVLLHDSWLDRVALLAHAPIAFPAWQRRVERLPGPRAGPRLRVARRRRVLILVSSDRRRGAEVFGERLARGLTELGWEVDVLSLTSITAKPLAEPEDAGADRIGRFDWHLIRTLRDIIRVNRPDVVFANGAATLRYGIAGVFAMRPKPRLVYASIGEPRYWLRSRWHRLQQRLLHRRLDMVLAVSDVTRRQVADILGVDESRLFVARTGVPIEFFEIESEPTAAELRVLFLGNLSTEKDPETALDVLTDLRKRHPAVLRFVGGGALEESLSRSAQCRDLEDAVTFTGSVDDVRPHLAWADILILTSKTEGFPTAVLEAAAAGVPAVAFDVGGTREAIVHGETGLLVEAGDLEAFSEAVERLAADPGLRGRLGISGRDRVARQFTLDRAVGQHDELLSRVIGARGSRTSESV